jgi:hypothetical protein
LLDLLFKKVVPMFDFDCLKQQVSEGLIVEEAETLAQIALLVPELLKVLEDGAEHGAAVVQASHKAKAVLREL